MSIVLTGCSFTSRPQNQPIEEIAEAAQSTSGEHFRTKLPFFTDGLLAISTPERMHNFLKKKVGLHVNQFWTPLRLHFH